MKGFSHVCLLFMLSDGIVLLFLHNKDHRKAIGKGWISAVISSIQIPFLVHNWTILVLPQNQLMLTKV